MKDGFTGYTQAAGLLEFREVIAEHIAESRGVSVTPEEVVVTPGAKPIIFFTLLALIDAGDEVIYPNPGFPAYESTINFVGGKPVPLPLLEEVDFSFKIEDLERAISPKTKLLIINSPQNPTVGFLTAEDLEAIALLANEHNFYILADEIYSRILYDTNHQSIISLPGMKERTILIDGHSKTYAMTGWRLGYGIAPQAIAKKIELLTINSNSCTCAFTQIAGIEAIKNCDDFVREMVAEFKKRRDVLVDGLNGIPGVSCLKPAGAFYAFPSVKDLPLSCEELASYLLEEGGVAVLAGSSFGEFGAGYLRLSYANSPENITMAIERTRGAIEKL